MTELRAGGPLTGVRVLEFAGLGPAPFCGMLLSDMGADVVRIDRPGSSYRAEDVEARGRRSVVLDLKIADDRNTALKLVSGAHILIEGYRPGVMERLGLGPKEAMEINPALVYGRMTGWGQTGPLAHKAGHDLNYLALSGALHAMGSREKPAIPLNLVADFGGGALYLAMGVLAAFHHANVTGQGQVVDCAMTEGVMSMMGMIYGDFAAGTWNDQRESNVIDGAAPFYNVYQCSDGKWLSVAAIEPKFYAALLQALCMEAHLSERQWQRELWPETINRFQNVFAGKSRDEWREIFSGTDACVTPVLSLQEAREDEQHIAREAFVVMDEILQPAPSPRFSDTPAVIQCSPARGRVDPDEVLAEWESSPGPCRSV